jgi:tetratricopeptide (TPR) repeat protein
LAPDTPLPYKCKAWNFWAWKGTTDQSRLTLEKMPQKQDSGWSLGNWFWQEFYQRNYQAALDRLSSSDEPFKGVTEFLPRSLLAGFVYQAMNQPDKASASFQTARTQLEKELQSRPDDARIHSSLGMAYAGLRRKSEAVHEGQTAVELYSVSRDAFEGPDYVRNLAIIYVMIGDESAAMDRIVYLLSIPSFFSIHLMKLDPRFDPLRGSSQYQKLLLSHKP